MVKLEILCFIKNTQKIVDKTEGPPSKQNTPTIDWLFLENENTPTTTRGTVPSCDSEYSKVLPYFAATCLMFPFS